MSKVSEELRKELAERQQAEEVAGTFLARKFTTAEKVALFDELHAQALVYLRHLVEDGHATYDIAVKLRETFLQGLWGKGVWPCIIALRER